MRAGKLDRTITLQRATRAINDAGTVADTWSHLATVRAELVSASATEEARPFGEAEATAITFRIRYLAGITTGDRVLYQGAAFDLTGIVEIGRRRALELRCERVPA